MLSDIWPWISCLLNIEFDDETGNHRCVGEMAFDLKFEKRFCKRTAFGAANGLYTRAISTRSTKPIVNGRQQKCATTLSEINE